MFRLLVQAGPDGMAAGAIARLSGCLRRHCPFICRSDRRRVIAQRRDGRSLIYSADMAR